MWQVLALAVCTAIRSFWRWLRHTVGLRVVTVATWSIRIAYFELLVSGFAAGMAWILLQELSYDKVGRHMNFEPGTGTTVSMLIVAIICLHVYNIYLVIVSTILKLEDKRLAFASVKAATCMCPNDKENIWAVVHERVEQVDAAIHMLRTIGRYDAAVKFNLDRGLCVELARDGINPFKVVCAVLMWEFWWITDMSSDSHMRHWSIYDILAFLIPAASLLFLGVLVYLGGERSIFAIEVGLWSGLVFLWISNSSYFFTREHVLAWTMSESTRWLQLACFAAMLAMNAYFYAGCLKVHRSAAIGVCGTENCRSCGGYDGPEYDDHDLSDHDVEKLTSPVFSPAVKTIHSTAVAYGSTAVAHVSAAASQLPSANSGRFG
eukprot:TRINITY_DN3726_c0_g1_i2.p1 TRINITY_DN3726_c0_g1~~TRINITY_DN3726_c0_g1_i2.p1  ORF type:complete len:377 (-),score=45.72 TRINITY_DN3726_c0_g1_i2:53-1183(-)